jgi:hypothetical protein
VSPRRLARARRFLDETLVSAATLVQVTALPAVLAEGPARQAFIYTGCICRLIYLALRARPSCLSSSVFRFALYLPHISALFVFKLRGTAAPPQFQTLDACEIEPYPTLGRGTPETPFFTLSLVRSATPLSFVRYRVVVSPFGQYPKAVLPEGECEEGTPNT